MKYEGVAKSFWTKSITKGTTINTLSEATQGLWQQNLLD
jgi:hypothetical protein